MRSSTLWCLAGISSPRVGAFVAPEPRAARRRPRAAGNQRNAGIRVAPTIAADAPTSFSFTIAKLKRAGQFDAEERSNNIVDDVWTSNRSIDATTEGDGPIELQDSSVDSTKWILLGGTALVLAAAAALAVTMKNDLGLDLELGQIRNDPSASIDMVLKALETMDPLKGMAYFVAFYILAEILAIPAFPLTASSGYLFGVWNGTASCLLGAAIAASVSFVIGKTILRGYVERVLEDNPKFQSIDRAIEREGFKLMLLLRLSPLFPFALSNYLYGASSIRFVPYFFGTLLGFAPGTFAYVYAGEIGKALTIDSATSEPWYVYAGGMAVVVALVKIVGDVASGVIEAMEEDDDGVGWEGDMDI
ncbi:hypothetical protein ACHAXT_001835 [Thalassiosira profunda]